MSHDSTAPGDTQRRWRPSVGMIITCGCIIALVSFGVRSSMGFFQIPMLNDTGWSFTTFGLAMAIQNIAWGVGQPVFGAFADKHGAWRTLAAGGLIYALGLYLMGTADAPLWLHIGGGVLVGLGVSAGSFGIILSVFARNVTPERRSLVFGVGTAAGSAGMFLFAPISVAMIERLGWSHTLVLFSILMLIVPVLAAPLYGNSKSSPNAMAEYEQTAGAALKEALAHPSYQLLMAGFFVCGFHVAFVAAHFPAYIDDIGIDSSYAGYAIALIGFLNIFGSLAAGILGQKHSKPYMLSVLYLCRSIAFAAFLLLPQTPMSVMIFSATLGLLWLSTVPPTNALVAVFFGTRHLGMLGGLVFFTHQVGSFAGVYLGGYMRDVYGSFDVVWWLGVALGLVAAVLHWPIKEAPVERPTVAAAE
ncbi:MAG: MFS transporter [Rhizobiaceae bacterium]